MSVPAASLRGWRAWRLAARPRTLPVGIAPVVMGTALAHAHGRVSIGPALAALTAALLIQIGANFANDAFDRERGADSEDRAGPPRAAQLGLLSPAQLKRGMALALGVATAVGTYLVAVGGWPIAGVGVLCIAAGVTYTGPLAFGYRGLGDLAVFVFFGLVAVCGTYYVQALELPGIVLGAALPVACLATAVLVVNNVRDLEGDRRAGKRTLAVRLGPRGARREYAVLVIAAYALLPVLWSGSEASAAVLLPVLTLPWAVTLIRAVERRDGEQLNPCLVDTVRLEGAFTLLFAAGWLV